MKNKIRKLIISSFIIIILLENVSIARYYKKLTGIKVKFQIVKPIIKLESDNKLPIEIFCNKNMKKFEHIFCIKNYSNDDDNLKISELDIEYEIEVKNSNENFPIKYMIYDYETGEKILNENNKTKKYEILKNVKYDKRYKLEIEWNDKSNMATYSEIDLNLNITKMSEKNVSCNSINKLKAFILRRDSTKLDYEIIKNCESLFTNQNVDVEIKFNKEIEPVNAFNISNDKKTLSKTFQKNEEVSFVAKDIYGNKKEVKYKITNIDKEPPKINGVENNKTYTKNVNILYEDNVGIKNINILKDSYSYINLNFTYGQTNYNENNLIIKNSSQKAKIKSHNILTENGKYTIIVTDFAENTSKKEIKIVK